MLPEKSRWFRIQFQNTLCCHTFSTTALTNDSKDFSFPQIKTHIPDRFYYSTISMEGKLKILYFQHAFLFHRIPPLLASS